MPVELDFIHGNEGVIIRGSGEMTGGELIEAIKEVFSGEERNREYRFGICDFSQIEKINMSVEEVVRLAKFQVNVSKHNPNILVGFAIEDKLAYGLVRMWQVYAETTGWKVKISNDYEEIRRWVDQQLC